MKKRILVIIDFQNDFMRADGALPVNHRKGDLFLIEKMNNFLYSIQEDFFDYALVSYDTHFKEYYNFTLENQLNGTLHCDFNSYGWNLSFDESFLEKKVQNTFYICKNTVDIWSKHVDHDMESLIVDEERLKMHHTLNKVFVKSNAGMTKMFNSMGDFVLNNFEVDDEIFICGVKSDWCVKYAIDGFLKRNFNVNVIRDLTRGGRREIDEVLKDKFYLNFKINNKLTILNFIDTM